MTTLADLVAQGGRALIAGAPAGHDARIIGQLARLSPAGALLIARDDVRLVRLAEGLDFFAPDVERIELPAWDCLPYDRASPHPEIVSRRVDALASLAAKAKPDRPRIVLTTVAAVLQRVPPRDIWALSSFVVSRGDPINLEDLITFLQANGYVRVETVSEAGECAVRGGIVDVFPSGRTEPVRIDLFGDEVESLRTFDLTSQRTTGKVEAVDLRPVSEVRLDPASIRRFRAGYRLLAGTAVADDPLYTAVSAGHRHSGMEHWLPLFHERLETVFDYLPAASVVVDHQVEDAVATRLEAVADYYQARRTIDAGRFAAGAAPYYPVSPESLFLDRDGLDAALAQRMVTVLSPFAMPEAERRVWDAGGRSGLDFAEARKRPDSNVFEAVIQRIREHQQAGRRVLVAAVSRGSRERLLALLTEHGLRGTCSVAGWAEAEKLAVKQVAFAMLPLERGFVATDLTVITEEDILGDRLVRRGARRAKPEHFLTEATSLSQGDLVVHVDHGIGRYEGLETLAVGGAPHDCLRLIYAGNDKLYLPVENIEMISRYGSDGDGVALDKLGGGAWQARKARMKQRIRLIADELIRVAAARALKEAPAAAPLSGPFDEFCARFPFTETDDQLKTIEDVVADLGSGRPTDRLVCGDVGFGKTEVALRAAFVVALEGRQVAVVVPTTLLCRQHHRTFSERFRGFPVRIAELSRFVSTAAAKAVKKELAEGTVDIVVGTHALLAKDVRFRDLGLLIIDEEQHFGVAHKEQLKSSRPTSTSSPSPRRRSRAPCRWRCPGCASSA